jgi:plasmid stabilization system protein ParE
MVRLNWTEIALNDINEIYDFIAKDSKFYAKNVVGAIRKKVKIVKKYPKIGRIIPEINIENYREIFQWNYRIMYKIIGEDIYILSIYHGARDFKRDKIE